MDFFGAECWKEAGRESCRCGDQSEAVLMGCGGEGDGREVGCRVETVPQTPPEKAGGPQARTERSTGVPVGGQRVVEPRTLNLEMPVCAPGVASLLPGVVSLFPGRKPLPFVHILVPLAQLFPGGKAGSGHAADRAAEQPSIYPVGSGCPQRQ